MTWKEVSLKQFLDIQKIYDKEMDDYEKSKQLIFILYGKEIYDIPVRELDGYLKEIASLLNTPPEQVKVNKEYVINGHKYKLSPKIEDMSTGQFWDFTEFSKTPTKNIQKILSCFLIPDGKKYGTGYDIDEVLKDMDSLAITDVNAISFFLLGKLRRLQKIILIYSIAEMMKGMNLKQKWLMTKRILKVCKSMDSLITF